MSRRGFTLVEMLIAIAILAIIATLFFGAFNYLLAREQQTTTETLVHTLGCQIGVQVGVTGFPPATLAELAPKLDGSLRISGGQVLDAWDRPLEYRVTGKQFRLWSLGADGVSGTADDIEYKRK